MTTYTEESVLCAFKINSWGIDRKDANAEQKLASTGDYSADAHKVVKQIITPEFKRQLDSGNALVNKIRYKFLFATGATSLGILPLKVKDKFIALVNEANSDRQAIVRSALEASYETEKEHARQRLGSSYREQDYPTIDEIAAKYKVSFFFMPLPKPEHTGVDDDDLKAAVEETRRETLKAARADAWSRIFKTCQDFVDRLSNYQARNKEGKGTHFHDSMVESIKDMVSTLDEMNIFGDKELTASLDALKAAIGDVAPETLKQSELVRIETLRLVQNVLDQKLPEPKTEAIPEPLPVPAIEQPLPEPEPKKITIDIKSLF